MVEHDGVGESAPKLSYAVEQRMRLLDFMLKHFGYFKRAALCDYFGISPGQAANDIRTYRQLNPHASVYDSYNKTHRASIDFKPYFN